MVYKICFDDEVARFPNRQNPTSMDLLSCLVFLPFHFVLYTPHQTFVSVDLKIQWKKIR